jgi:beta-lactamase regulating signal transducer with metallopeptidase domain
MLSETFYWVLNMSIIGAATGLIVLVCRKVRALPRLAVYLLWLIPLVRLWLPFGISSRFSLLSLLSQFTTKTVPFYESNQLPELVYTNYMMAAQDYNPVVYKTPVLDLVFRVSSLVWVIVFAAMLIAMLLLYYFTRAELKNAVLLHDNIYQSGNITSPAVYGIFRPRIILPVGISDEELPMILLHEQAHIARRDNLFRTVALLTACLHWFNPLSWIFLKRFFEDMELACDAKILKKMDKTGKKLYASALIGFTGKEDKGLFVSAFGGARVRVRISHILSYKSLSWVSAVFLAMLLVAVAFALLTNARLF